MTIEGRQWALENIIETCIRVSEMWTKRENSFGAVRLRSLRSSLRRICRRNWCQHVFRGNPTERALKSCQKHGVNIVLSSENPSASRDVYTGPVPTGWSDYPWDEAELIGFSVHPLRAVPIVNDGDKPDSRPPPRFIIVIDSQHSC